MRLNTFLIEHSQETSELDEETKKVVTQRAMERLKQMTFYATTSGCLRAKILSYFGETPKEQKCHNCSGCLAAAAERDVTQEAGRIVACVLSMGGKYGKGTLVKVLLGERDEKIRERQLDKLSSFGCLRNEREFHLRTLIDELIMDEVLELTDGQYPLVKPGPRAREALLGDEPIRVSFPREEARQIQKSRVKMKPAVDKRLLAKLIEVRRRIAEEQHVPPFIIFTNATLKDMAIKRPKTRMEMLNVDGVGENKMERYGMRFMLAIQKYEIEKM